MPQYSPVQVIGVQRQALRASGPASGFAALRMADVYVTPTSPQYDSFRAARWYAYAVGMGNTSAAFSLGQMYIVGQGVPQDPERGYGLIGWAGKYGDLDARTYLAQNPPPPPDPQTAPEALRPVPPPPSAAPPDNSSSDSSDVIGWLAVGAAAVAGVAIVSSLLGSNSDATPPVQESSSHHGSLDICMEANLGKVFNYEVQGVDLTAKGCI